MPTNTAYMGQGRGPIGLTSAFTASGFTLSCAAATSSESQIAVPARLQQVNRTSWLTGDCVIATPLQSNVSAGVTWVSYVSSAGTIVLRMTNATASVVTVASSVVWNFMGFAGLP